MKNIPSHIQSKIRVEGDCWIWTGYVLPGRKNVPRLNIPGPNAIEGVSRPILHVFDHKPQPRATFEGQSRPASRVVMAHHLDVPYAQVPRMKNICGHHLCVNPEHHHLGRKPPGRRFQHLVEDEKPVVTDLLASLKSVEPLPELGPENAAEELGVPSIPDEVWAQYMVHCLETQE